MIRLRFTPPVGDSKWDEWVDKARQLVDVMLADEEHRPAIDDDLYKAHRDKFLEASHDKCAYCELKVAPGQRNGDVEHYRPKGRARDLKGNVVKVPHGGQMVNHPGYYWLAYDHTNLLPSCSACNRRAMDDTLGENTGKSDLFPTLDDTWASRPDEIANEQPALLNPWLPQDDPSLHFTFDTTRGLMFGTTERGKITEKVLGLNRRGLPEAHIDACLAVRRAVRTLAGDLVAGQDVTVDQKFVDDVVDGVAEYTAFCRVALQQAVEKLSRLQAAADRIAHPDD